MYRWQSSVKGYVSILNILLCCINFTLKFAHLFIHISHKACGCVYSLLKRMIKSNNSDHISVNYCCQYVTDVKTRKKNAYIKIMGKMILNLPNELAIMHNAICSPLSFDIFCRLYYKSLVSTLVY